MAKSHPREFEPAEVASVFWHHLPPNKRKIPELTEKLLPGQGKDRNFQNQFGKKLREAEELGLVKHVVLSSTSTDGLYLPLRADLEDEVRRRHGLRDVVVVDVSGLKVPKGSPMKNRAAWVAYDDMLHQCCGAWGGRLLASLTRPDDRVACGGGRGPFYTVEHCNIPAACRTGVKGVVSLTGKMTAQPWNPPREVGVTAHLARRLDADCIATALKSSLAATEERLVDRSITADPKKSPDASGVTLAVIGIGAMGQAGCHRLVCHEGSEDLEPVAKELKKLNDLIAKLDPKPGRMPFPHVCGDVANCLFLITAETEKIPPEKNPDLKALRDLVDSLNNKFVNIDPKVTLKEICRQGIVLAIAGGPNKAGAIAHVVKQREPWITHLVTDSLVAEYLIKMDK